MQSTKPIYRETFTPLLVLFTQTYMEFQVLHACKHKHTNIAGLRITMTTTSPPCPPQIQGPLVFSGSAEGGVSVWENRCSDRDPLRLLHHWSSQVTGLGGGRLTLSPRGDKVFLAYGRAWLNILQWRTGELWAGPGADVCEICIIPSPKHLFNYHRGNIQVDQSQQRRRGNRLCSSDGRSPNWLQLRPGKRREHT